MKRTSELQTWVVVHDLHFPSYHRPTWLAALDFIKRNKIAGLILAGDQFDNLEISHHTKGKPLFREQGAYQRNTRTFDELILKPVERLLGKGVPKVYIIGNHERFEQDLIEEKPELQGVIEHVTNLRLEERGWEIIPLGHCKRIGKLSVIHGEVLTGIGNQAGMFPSKKAVELYAGNVLAGHTHAPQSYTRVSPIDAKDTWMGWIAPIAGTVNPAYIRNRPTAWLTGLTLVELFPDGCFNLFPCITSPKGRFAYGGKVYGGK